MVQWLGLHASTAGGMGAIPGQGTKILYALQQSLKKKIQTATTKKQMNQILMKYIIWGKDIFKNIYWEGIVRELKMDTYTLLYLKWITNRDLL